MPPQEEAFRKQKAVLWSVSGRNDAYGQPEVGSPVEIDVRWITERREIQDENGNTIVLESFAHVGQVIRIGSHLWLGELSEWLAGGSQVSDQEVMVVRTFSDTPDIKGRYRYREAGLMRLYNKGG